MLDISQELILCRHRDGIRLERPKSQKQFAQSSVGALFSLPFSICFYNANHQFVSCNDSCLEIAGVQSANDFIGFSNEKFTEKELSLLAESNNEVVIRSERMIMSDESGLRKDGFQIQTLTFKFPWYYASKVVGILGCSIITSSNNLAEIANSLLQLASVGLVNNDHFSDGGSFSVRKKICLDLTERENEVLSLLVRCKTAKEIGRELNVSYKVVQKHVANIKRKTGYSSDSALYDQFA